MVKTGPSPLLLAAIPYAQLEFVHSEMTRPGSLGQYSMSNIIDFKAKEAERRQKRIRALLHKALTGLLDDKEMDELRALTRRECH